MLLSWLKRQRRSKLLSEPFPESWLPYLQKNVAHYAYLSEAEKTKLRDDLRVFIAEKRWEGCGGLQISEGLARGESVASCDGGTLLALSDSGELSLTVAGRSVWTAGTAGGGKSGWRTSITSCSR